MESKIYEWIEFEPHEGLKKYIDAYWISSTNSLYIPTPKKIFPDACTEVFANTGSNTMHLNDTIALNPGIIYFGGTLTSWINFSGVPNSNFFGIRFKPGGFRTFFRMPLHETKGQFHELQSKDLQFIFNDQKPATTVSSLNDYFLKHLTTSKERFHAITDELYATKGNLKIDRLSREYEIGFRALERLFNDQVGISAKELSTIIRFQAALKLLKDPNYKQSFLDLAFHLGYYDHSHLTNDIKKLTGMTPSELRNYFQGD